MRVMIVDPGFSYSTLAVAESYARAFQNLGYEIMEYDTLEALQKSKKAMAGTKHDLQDLIDYACSPIIQHVINDGIDMIFSIHGYFVSPNTILALRRIGCKVCLILTDDPMQVDISSQWSKFYDFVFTNEKNTIKFHKNCFYLPIAVDQTVFKSNEFYDNKYISDILFAGSMYKERVDFVNENKNIQEMFLRYKTVIVGASKLKFDSEEIDKLVVENKISYEEMAKYTRMSNIVIDLPRNEYRDGIFGNSNSKNIGATYLNPRIYEAAACGVLPVTTNERSEIDELFPESLIPRFSCSAELVYIVDRYMKDLDIRKSTCRIIQKHCLENHTYEHRIKTIEKLLNIKPSKKIFVGNRINDKIVEKWKENWKENFEIAQKRGWYTSERSIERFKNTTSEEHRAIIISNGPSIERTLDKMNHMKGFKFCVNDSLRFTINPSFGVVIHPDRDVYDRCYADIPSYKIKDRVLLASSVADYHVIEKWIESNGLVYFFNTSDKEEIKKEVVEYNKYPVLQAGCTVGYSAILLAIYMGFKQIEIFGLDLSFMDKKYAWTPLLMKDIKGQTIFVEDVKGEATITDTILLRTRDHIFDLIKDNPDIKFRVHGRGILYSKSLGNLENEV